MESDKITEYEDSDLYFKLYDDIKRLSDYYGDKDLEVEARIGYQSRSGFVSGVTEKEFSILKRSLLNDKMLISTHKIIVDRFYYVNNERYRFSFNENNEPIEVIKKTRIKNISHEWDETYSWRISISSERKTLPPQKVFNGRFDSERRKQRYSFKSIVKPMWVIDITQVTTASEKSYEIEIELLSLYNLKTSLIQLCQVVIRIQNIITSAQKNGFPDVCMERVSDNEYDYILNEYTSCFGGHDDVGFLGTSPTPIPDEYRKLNQIRHKYFISDKPVGVRYMMLIHKSQGVLLISEQMRIYVVPHLKKLSQYLADRGHTLIDCELVRHRSTFEPYFLIFDCVCFDGEFIGNDPYSRRISKIGEIVGVFRNKLGNSPINIIGKFIIPVNDYKKLFANLKQNEGVKFYEDGKRSHDIEGFIFIPKDMPYSSEGCKKMYKWYLKGGDPLSFE